MTPIIVILCLAALVWAVVLTLRGSLLAGCLTYLVLASCFGPYFWSIDLGITITIDRFFLVGMVGAFLVQWRLGLIEPKPLTKIDGVMFVFIGLLGVSTFTHDYHNTIRTDVPIIQHLINGYLIPLTVYWIARQSKHTERSMTMLLAGLAAFGVYLALTGIFETQQVWALVFPKYIADPEIGLHFGRARGPMLQSVSYGVYLATCLLAAWLWREKLAGQYWLLALLLVPLMLAAIYLTKTRSVWVGAVSGLLIVLAFTLKGRVRVAVIGGILAVGLCVGVMKLSDINSMQREGTVADTRKSTSMRGSFAYVSWKMFLDKPVFGFGFGQFAKEKLPYLSDRETELHLESIRDYVHHSTFLAVLTEVGLVGLAVFVTMLGGWIWAGYKVAQSERAPPWARRHAVLMLGVLGVAFWQMVGHEITFTPLDQSLIYMMAGITVGLYAQFAKAPAAAEFTRPEFNTPQPAR